MANASFFFGVKPQDGNCDKKHPEKITWNPTMEVWKMMVLFSWHVNFQGQGSIPPFQKPTVLPQKIDVLPQNLTGIQVRKVLSIHDEFAIALRF